MKKFKNDIFVTIKIFKLMSVNVLILKAFYKYTCKWYIVALVI